MSKRFELKWKKRHAKKSPYLSEEGFDVHYAEPSQLPGYLFRLLPDTRHEFWVVDIWSPEGYNEFYGMVTEYPEHLRYAKHIANMIANCIKNHEKFC